MCVQADDPATGRPTSPTAAASSSYDRERLALLRRENALLGEQNTALDLEVSRLAAERDQALERRGAAAAEAARTATALREKAAEADELSTSCAP